MGDSARRNFVNGLFSILFSDKGWKDNQRRILCGLPPLLEKILKVDGVEIPERLYWKSVPIKLGIRKKTKMYEWRITVIMECSLNSRDTQNFRGMERYLKSKYSTPELIVKDPVNAFFDIAEVIGTCMNYKKTFAVVTTAFYLTLANKGIKHKVTRRKLITFVSSQRVQKVMVHPPTCPTVKFRNKPYYKAKWYQLQTHLDIAEKFSHWSGRIPNDFDVLREIQGVGHKCSSCILEAVHPDFVSKPGVDVHGIKLNRTLGTGPLDFGDEGHIRTPTFMYARRNAS